jgi:hypothetical protein
VERLAQVLSIIKTAPLMKEWEAVLHYSQLPTKEKNIVELNKLWRYCRLWSAATAADNWSQLVAAALATEEQDIVPPRPATPQSPPSPTSSPSAPPSSTPPSSTPPLPFSDESFYEQHKPGSPWSLPLLIEMTSAPHLHMDCIKVLAILWYADRYQPEATSKHQKPELEETFHWRKDVNGEDREGDESSRSAYVHQVVHIEVPENYVARRNTTAGHPALHLVGRFFGSFHAVPRFLGMKDGGWDVWSVRNLPNETMRKIVLNADKAGGYFLNHNALDESTRFSYPLCLLDTRTISLQKQPRIPARDLFVNLCLQECNVVRCGPRTAEYVEEFAKAFQRELKTEFCPHGFVYQIEDIDDSREEKRYEGKKNVDLKKQADARKHAETRRNLDLQLKPMGRLLRFDDVKLCELEEIPRYFLPYPYWSEQLLELLRSLQQLKFPSSVKIRQMFTLSFNDDLLCDNVKAIEDMYKHYFKPLNFLAFARPSMLSRPPNAPEDSKEGWYISENDPEERRKMVIMTVWQVRTAKVRLLDSWRRDLRDGDGVSLHVPMRLGALEEALKDTVDALTEAKYAEIYNEVLSEKNYLGLQANLLRRIDTEKDERAKPDLDGTKETRIDQARRAIIAAEIELEWAEEQQFMHGSQIEIKAYRAEYHAITRKRRAMVDEPAAKRQRTS